MKIGVIDVGGGMRGIYAAGVLDCCLKQNVVFDYCIGISAGSANMTSYLAKQPGRNYKFYHDYSFRKQYMGLKNLLKTGSYINFEYIYGTLSNSGGEDPLDFQTLLHSKSDLTVIASDAITGAKKVFHKADMFPDNYRILMASSCVPGVDQPVQIGNSLYFDGALADPVPIQMAFDHGCDRVVLILTKPVNEVRKPGKDLLLAKMIQRKFPLAAENMKLRAHRYNEGIRLAQELERQRKVLILSPDSTVGVDTLKRDKDALHTLYEKGIKDGGRILGWIAQK